MNKLNLSIMLIVVSSLLITGCSKQFIYEGNGEYAELTHRNIVYRDLTQPLSENNFNEIQTISNTPDLLIDN